MPHPRLPLDPPSSLLDASFSVPLNARHDATRAPRFWHAAVSATKGLFNQPTRMPLDSELASGSTVPPVENKQKRVRRSISTPALKASASTSNLRREIVNNPSPSLPPLFTKRSFDQSPRKLKPKGAAARHLAISSPSLPKSLDSLDSPHPKLAYPLSPIPSPVGSTFSLKTPSLQSTSQLSQPDAVPSVNSDTLNDTRPSRRRTKSAPGAKLGKRPFFSPAMAAAARESVTPSDESSTPIIIDIASPSIASPDSAGSFPSPPLETPRTPLDYFEHKSSPLGPVISPRSFTSVKRKPVPRHLYMDPPEHDASAPCTPVLTPVPNAFPSPNGSPSTVQKESSGTLHTPLLPSSELILKACNPSKPNTRGLNLLPIGQVGSGNSVRRQHRRSVSEHGRRRAASPETTFPSPWFTTNANGSMTPLITPAEEQAPFSFAHDLSPAPRAIPQSPPLTPEQVAEEISAFSDNTSARSSFCRSGALSPLTDDEIDAIRCFLRRHATGHRERLRRKASRRRNSHSRDKSVASCSYDMHTQILESYATDEDEFFSLDGSEDDADAESHVPASASETYSTSSASLIDSQGSEDGDEDDRDMADFDAETPIIGKETNGPNDAANRGTFGYYGTPLARRSGLRYECPGAYACDDGESRPSLPPRWMEHGSNGSDVKFPSTSNWEEDAQHKEVECDGLEDATKTTPIAGPPRSSSLYYRSSSDYAQQSDDDALSCLRASHQHLVPKSMFSDSESDRRVSSSTSSLSPSTSTGRSTLASGIGLAIIPPEHFAYFDKFANYECVPSYTPSEFETDGLEGSPTTLACSSPSPRALRRCNMRCENPVDLLRTDLTGLQVRILGGEAKLDYNTMNAPSVLKPALQIIATSTCEQVNVHLPSPTDTMESYPLQTFVGERKQRNAMASVYANEAVPENVKSFMNLTPNEPTTKRSRARLRQLFSRANLKSAKGRKVPA